MDESLQSKTVLVYDHGNYVETAIRLTREFGRVLYFKPWKAAGPKTNDLIVGDGYDNVERVEHFFDVVNEVDLFVFPEIYDGDLQLDLERRGKRVWGSRKGEEFEYKRGLFIETLEQVGLPVSQFKKCIGVTELREYLSEHDNQWIKIEMRGDRETWHHENIKISTPILDALAYFYGPVKELVPFWVFESVDSDIEAAYDGFLVTSPELRPQFPTTAFLGYEDKNQAHIVHAVDYDQLPEEVRMVNDKFAEPLAERWFRGAFGTEIKIVSELRDEGVFFIDATCRQPSPPGEIILEQAENLGELMYYGAEGNLVEIEKSHDFGVSVNLYSDWAGSNHLPVQIPDAIRQWVKLSESYRHDGIDWVIPKIVNDPVTGRRENIGCVVALGDSIEEAIETVTQRCEELTSFDTTYQISSLGECLRRIREGEKHGIKFSNSRIPSPSTVLGHV